MEHLAEVRLWGKQVGALAYDPATGFSTFEYSPQWRESAIEIAPLHMPVAGAKYSFPGLSAETYRGLPAVFADTLPDDFGNAVINAWLARTGRDVASFTPVERLLYTGNRGMGALEFSPAIKRGVEEGGDLALDSLVAMAQTVLDERIQLQQRVTADVGAGPEQANDSAMQAILQVGTSAGGARAKAVVAVNADRTQIRSGQVDAPEGFEHYLLKFDGVEEHKTDSETFGDPQGFGRMEYAYYLMAKDAGINISPSELLLEGGRAHFMTRRFERDGNRKLHYVSLCAMDHADYKKPGAYSYEQLLAVARQLKLPRANAIEIFRRMAFNVVARNHDDHTKNFGFLLDGLAGPKIQAAQWRLSPAFDIAYSYKKGSPWVDSHQLSINGKRDNFTRSDLLAVAALIGNFTREAPKIINRVIEVVAQWPVYAQQAGVHSALKVEVEGNLRLGV
ncbi:MAG: type II toxin-antitoxin system HipA family toxin [Gammaproteobacteria bacterium]|nr:type II toxin-antitoxin system HipA family toxin [Gammaproteobacteria bacterium]MBQ0838339.1 type II toxin-antitoxin system HipA family toxin [Gammaproteobacteria bacterium]